MTLAAATLTAVVYDQRERECGNSKLNNLTQVTAVEIASGPSERGQATWIAEQVSCSLHWLARFFIGSFYTRKI